VRAEVVAADDHSGHSGAVRSAVRRWVLAVGLALILPTALGCTSDCPNIECSNLVTVWWAKSQLPTVAAYRLCVNDLCNAAAPTDLGKTGLFMKVEAPSPTVRGQIQARLDLLDADGATRISVSGTGTLNTPHCGCAYVSFRARLEGLVTAEAP
jgi:hypothetical protein